MSSWFDTGLNTLNSLTQNVTESVQNAIPKEHQELIAKLTLNTDEMKSTRQKLGDEAKRKEDAKRRLGQLLPWETKDADREILVDECKDAILDLSKNTDTFFGPYEMPMLNVQLEDNEGEGDTEKGIEDDKKVNVGRAIDEQHETGDNADVEQEQSKHVKLVASQHFRPSLESKNKLAKLQPLPPLLEEFDLDSHVELIQRLLTEDPALVRKQATLSGRCHSVRLPDKNAVRKTYEGSPFLVLNFQCVTRFYFCFSSQEGGPANAFFGKIISFIVLSLDIRLG